MDEAEYCNRVSIMVDGRIEALDTPQVLKQTFGADTMDDVFYMLARKATRNESSYPGANKTTKKQVRLPEIDKTKQQRVKETTKEKNHETIQSIHT